MKTIFGTLIFLSSLLVQGFAADKPNVIIIFIDDMGYGDVGFNGATGPKTPELDRMGKEGMIFDDFYVGCAVCSGSRTALMTGTHYQRLSMNAVLFPQSTNGLHPDEMTIAEMLKAPIAEMRDFCVGGLNENLRDTQKKEREEKQKLRDERRARRRAEKKKPGE